METGNSRCKRSSLFLGKHFERTTFHLPKNWLHKSFSLHFPFKFRFFFLFWWNDLLNWTMDWIWWFWVLVLRLHFGQGLQELYSNETQQVYIDFIPKAWQYNITILWGCGARKHILWLPHLFPEFGSPQ